MSLIDCFILAYYFDGLVSLILTVGYPAVISAPTLKEKEKNEVRNVFGKQLLCSSSYVLIWHHASYC